MQRNVNQRLHLLSNSPAFKRGNAGQRTALTFLVIGANSIKREAAAKRESRKAARAAKQSESTDIFADCIDGAAAIRQTILRHAAGSNSADYTLNAQRTIGAPAHTQATFIVAALQSAAKTIRAVKASRVNLYSRRQALANYGAASNPSGNNLSDF